MASACGEIILADTVHFEAQCPRLYEAPNFGSFVRAESEGVDVYAVVYHIVTECIDSNRKTQALGLEPAEIERQLPHLDLVLRTTFAARVIGFRVGETTCAHLPAQPARIHCFVHPAGDEAIRALTATPGFLRALATAPDLPVEDVLGSTIDHARDAWKGQPEAEATFNGWCKYLARLFRGDYDRFEAIMSRFGPPAPAAGAPWEQSL